MVKKLAKLAMILFLVLISIPVFGQYNKIPRVISRSRQVFNNTHCVVTNTCDLLQIRYVAEDYEIWVDNGMHYGTRFFAHYLTNSIDSLENYAFVQFVKGCKYLSDDKGAIWSNVFVDDNFGKEAVVNYKNWVIESADTDPIYFSTQDSRHFNYKWNTEPNSIDRTTEKFFGLEKPLNPELYITDIPGTAFYKDGQAKNTSLIFKTCLYKTSDIPRETVPENINFAEPINCFYWYSSWIYNHEADRFEHSYEIAPACNK